MISDLRPIQERRQAYASKPDVVKDILKEGQQKAQAIASETMQQVREAVFKHEL
jgi:tryptophanyl-tRNA synthetase